MRQLPSKASGHHLLRKPDLCTFPTYLYLARIICSSMIPGRSSESAPIRCLARGCIRSELLDLKGDLKYRCCSIHVDNRCATTENLLQLIFPFIFSYVSLIHQVVADNKEVDSFVPRTDGLIELFSSKNNALFKKAKTFSDETAGSVDLVSGLSRVIKEEGLEE